MSRIERLFVVGLVLAVFVALGARYLTSPAQPPRVDTVVVQRGQQAQAVADTTSLVVRRFAALRDSLRRVLARRDTVVDTVPVERIVERLIIATETLTVQCERCARELASYRHFADSVIRARDDTIAVRDRQLAAAKKRGHLEAALAFVGGVFVAR